MKFQLADSTTDLTLRLLSDNGRWEMGFRHELYGFAFALGLVGDDAFLLYYPVGADGLLWALVTDVMIRLLALYPEGIDPATLRQSFPTYQYKPIDRDRCWGELQAMLTGTFPPSRTCPDCGRTSYKAHDIERCFCPSCHRDREHDRCR